MDEEVVLKPNLKTQLIVFIGCLVLTIICVIALSLPDSITRSKPTLVLIITIILSVAGGVFTLYRGIIFRRTTMTLTRKGIKMPAPYNKTIPWNWIEKIGKSEIKIGGGPPTSLKYLTVYLKPDYTNVKEEIISKVKDGHLLAEMQEKMNAPGHLQFIESSLPKKIDEVLDLFSKYPVRIEK